MNHQPRLSLIHGDFHHRQIVKGSEIGGGEIGIVDWDQATNGPTPLDLASYASHVYVDAIVNSSPGDRATNLTEAHLVVCALLSGYRARHEMPETLFQIYTAHQLIRMATVPFRCRVPQWPDKIESIVALAARIAGPVISAAPAGPVPPPHWCPGLVVESVEDSRQLPAWLVPALDPQSSVDCVTPRVAAALAETDAPTPRRLRAIRLRRYKPDRRALVEYEFDAPTESVPCVKLLGKVCAKGLDLTSFDLQQRLRHWTQRAGAKFQVPPLAGVVPELQMWLQFRSAGREAEQELTPESDPRLAEQIALALFDLHRCPIKVRRKHTHADELAILHDRLERVANERPELSDRVRGLKRSVRRLLHRYPCIAPTLIHRDFHPAQVLCHDDQITILDFDLAAHGDPAIDVGNFIAHLKESAIRRFGDGNAMTHHEQAFLATYLSQIKAVGHESAAAHTIVSLARHISISHHIRQRQAATESIVEHCESLVEQVLLPTPVSFSR